MVQETKSIQTNTIGKQYVALSHVSLNNANRRLATLLLDAHIRACNVVQCWNTCVLFWKNNLWNPQRHKYNMERKVNCWCKWVESPINSRALSPPASNFQRLYVYTRRQFPFALHYSTHSKRVQTKQVSKFKYLMRVFVFPSAH